MSESTGSRVTASCVVETTHDARVSWLVNGRQKTGETTKKTLGEIVSNLIISAEEFQNWNTITCKAEHSCFSKNVEKTINVKGKMYVSLIKNAHVGNSKRK